MAGIQSQSLNLLVAVLLMVVCVSSSAQTASFVARTDFLVGQGPSAVATADLNADGKLDLVTSNEFSNSVSVLLGNGDGTFQPAVSYPVGANPIAVSIGDFTGGGKLDIFTVNSNSSVSVLLGNGDGTFQSQVATNIVTNQLSDVTVGLQRRRKAGSSHASIRIKILASVSRAEQRRMRLGTVNREPTRTKNRALSSSSECWASGYQAG